MYLYLRLCVMHEVMDVFIHEVSYILYHYSSIYMAFNHETYISPHMIDFFLINAPLTRKTSKTRLQR